jgi:hypothetical protein
MYGPALIEDSGASEWEGGAVALYAAVPPDRHIEGGVALPAYAAPVPVEHFDGGGVALYASVPIGRDAG